MLVRKHGCEQQKQKKLEMPWRGGQLGGSSAFIGQAAESASSGSCETQSKANGARGTHCSFFRVLDTAPVQKH